MKNFADLTEREVLAVAISSEEEDSRIYMTFAEDLAERYPDSAKVFEEILADEEHHVDYLETQLQLIETLGEALYLQNVTEHPAPE